MSRPDLVLCQVQSMLKFLREQERGLVEELKQQAGKQSGSTSSSDSTSSDSSSDSDSSSGVSSTGLSDISSTGLSDLSVSTTSTPSSSSSSSDEAAPKAERKKAKRDGGDGAKKKKKRSESGEAAKADSFWLESDSSEGDYSEKKSVKQAKQFIDASKDSKQKKKKAKLVATVETRLLVWGMSFATTERDIREFFKEKGAIKSVEFFKDQRGQPAGCALVEFETCAQAVDAEKMAGQKLLNWDVKMISEFSFNVFVTDTKVVQLKVNGCADSIEKEDLSRLLPVVRNIRWFSKKNQFFGVAFVDLEPFKFDKYIELKKSLDGTEIKGKCIYLETSFRVK